MKGILVGAVRCFRLGLISFSLVLSACTTQDSQSALNALKPGVETPLPETAPPPDLAIETPPSEAPAAETAPVETPVVTTSPEEVTPSGASGSAASSVSAPPTTVSEGAPVDSSTYSYDSSLNMCVNSLGEVGYNRESFGTCGAKPESVSLANLSKLNLSGVHWPEIRMDQVNLTDANLTGANLSKSTITRTTFSNTKLNEADMTDVVVSQSVIKEYELVEKMLDQGARLGIENELPRLFVEIESVLNGETSEVGDHRLGGDQVERIQRNKDVVKKNRKMLASLRPRYQELKSKRDRLKEVLERSYGSLGHSKSEMVALLAQYKKVSGDFRIKRLAYLRDSRAVEIGHLKDLGREQREIASQVLELKRKTSTSVPEIASMIKEVRDLVNETYKYKSSIVSVEKENESLREKIKREVARQL